MNYVDPLNYIQKIPSVKRFYKEKGIEDISRLTQKTADNPKFGINIIQAGIFTGSLIILVMDALFNFLQPFFSIHLTDWIFKNDTNGLIFIAFVLIPTFLFSYLTLYKDNKYLQYFKEFDDMDRNATRKYGWLSFGLAILVVFLLIFSFKFLK